MSLSVEGVGHRHPGRDCDTPESTTFALEPGEHALLVGPNGSGKTTLLLRLVGLLDGPGTVRVAGEPVSRSSIRRLRRRIGLVWQNPDDALLLPTVAEDVALGPLNDGLASGTAIAVARAWLDRLGIARLSERAVRELSFGERQLVAVAGVLAREPGLLLLDEPSSALDDRHRERLATVLCELPSTMLLVAHDSEWWSGRGFERRVRLPVPRNQLP